jgi:hypothetical protein
VNSVVNLHVCDAGSLPICANITNTMYRADYNTLLLSSPSIVHLRDTIKPKSYQPVIRLPSHRSSNNPVDMTL